MSIARKCLICNKEFFARKYAIKKGEGKYCSRECYLPVKNRENVYKWKERFFENVKKNFGKNRCWEWLGTKDKDGYGKFHTMLLDTYRAHKVSYIMNFGKIPKGMLVCHKCDNPSCVNPKHLWLGTSDDNTKDRINKGRDINTRGENHSKAKLNDTIVKSIRKRMKKGESCSVIARELNMNQSTINAIKHYKTWKHIK